MKRRAEKRHDLIADEFIQRAVIFKDRLGRQGVKTIETLRDFRRRKPLRQGRKAAHVDEQDRNLADLPARRSQFVSERAKVGVFARRADLHEPERNRKQPQKRHQTFLAPLGRGEPAMKPARDLRGAQVPPQSHQESSHKTSQTFLKFCHEGRSDRTASRAKSARLPGRLPVLWQTGGQAKGAKVTGSEGPSSRANARDLRRRFLALLETRISPGACPELCRRGRNDKVSFFASLACPSIRFRTGLAR